MTGGMIAKCFKITSSHKKSKIMFMCSFGCIYVVSHCRARVVWWLLRTVCLRFYFSVLFIWKNSVSLSQAWLPPLGYTGNQSRQWILWHPTPPVRVHSFLQATGKTGCNLGLSQSTRHPAKQVQSLGYHFSLSSLCVSFHSAKKKTARAVIGIDRINGF